MNNLSMEENHFKSYDLVVKKYSGIDYLKNCLYFPHTHELKTSSEAITEFMKLPFVLEVFNLSEELMKKDNLPSIFSYSPLSPAKTLIEVKLNNLWQFTSQVAMAQMIIKDGMIPSLLIGTGLGWMAKLVVSDVLSFDEAFYLIAGKDITPKLRPCRNNIYDPIKNELLKIRETPTLELKKIQDILVKSISVDEIFKTYKIPNFIDLTLGESQNLICNDEKINKINFLYYSNLDNLSKKKSESSIIDFGKLKILKNIIKKMTGYEIEGIGLEDNYQNDLGIDSIKKANIIFKYIEETDPNFNSKINLSNIDSLKDTYQLTAKESTIERKEKQNFRLLTNHWECEVLPNSSKEKKYRNIVNITLMEFLANQSHINISNEKTLLILDARDINPSTFYNNNGQFLKNLLLKSKQIKKEFQQSEVEIALIFKSKDSYLSYSPIITFFKCLKKEEFINYFKPIYFDEKKLNEPQLTSLIQKEMMNDNFEEVHYKDCTRFIKRFSNIESQNEPHLKLPKSILAIGGSSGITFEILKSFPKPESINLIVMGRKSLEEVKKNMTLLSDRFKSLSYIKSDITQKESINKILQQKEPLENKRIDLILNSSGSKTTKGIKNIETNELFRNLQSKIEPFLNLETLTNYIKIEKIIHFGSIFSEFGWEGESIYSFSNSLLHDKITKSKNNHSYLAWSGWEEVGMTKDPFVLNAIKNQGANLIKKEDATELFFNFLRLNNKSAIVLEKTDPVKYSKSLNRF